MVSVGIASNKMLAKLASQAIKPDGILVIDGEPAMQKLLKTTAVSRLPRCGGKVTDTLTLAGVHTVADLQVSIFSPLALVQMSTLLCLTAMLHQLMYAYKSWWQPTQNSFAVVISVVSAAILPLFGIDTAWQPNQCKLSGLSSIS